MLRFDTIKNYTPNNPVTTHKNFVQLPKIIPIANNKVSFTANPLAEKLADDDNDEIIKAIESYFK